MLPIQTLERDADSMEVPSTWSRKTQKCAEMGFVKRLNTERM